MTTSPNDRVLEALGFEVKMSASRRLCAISIETSQGLALVELTREQVGQLLTTLKHIHEAMLGGSFITPPGGSI